MIIAPLLLTLALSAGPETPPTLHIEADARRRRITLELGPVSLPGNVGYGTASAPLGVAGAWGVDGWLRSVRVEVVDAAGNVFALPVLHHAALVAPADRELFRPVARRIVAFGQETDAIRLPGQLGYRIHPAD